MDEIDFYRLNKKEAWKQAIGLFFTRYQQKSREIRGVEIKPQWGKKEGQLLKTDLDRCGYGNLTRSIELFFSDQVRSVADFTRFKQKAGYSYGVFHGCLDKLLMEKEDPIVPCTHCGKRRGHETDCPISIQKREREAERDRLAEEIKEQAGNIDLVAMFKEEIERRKNGLEF
jgi:hypothetical protein